MTYAGFAVGKEVAITIDAVGIKDARPRGEMTQYLRTIGPWADTPVG